MEDTGRRDGGEKGGVERWRIQGGGMETRREEWRGGERGSGRMETRREEWKGGERERERGGMEERREWRDTGEKARKREEQIRVTTVARSN